ncbi:MAG: hypothetical protein ABH827_03430 [bacterium]
MKITRLSRLFFCLFLLFTTQVSAQKPPASPNAGCSNENGNDCFLNATMQALFHTKPLRNFLRKNTLNDYK